MNESLRNNQIEYVKLDSDNFDLRILIRSFFLNKKLIAIITFLSMAISLIYASTKEKIYKGSFQIVLKNDSNSSNNSYSSELLNNALGSRIGNLVRSQTAQDINTQVEILRDLKYHIERGVDGNFEIKTLTADSDDMWYPRRKELEAAGVVNSK